MGVENQTAPGAPNRRAGDRGEERGNCDAEKFLVLIRDMDGEGARAYAFWMEECEGANGA